MIAVLLAGALTGMGALLVVRGLAPARPPLAVALNRMQRAPLRSQAQEGRLTQRLGPWATETLRRAGIDFAGTGPDLAVFGRSLEAHVASKLTAAAFGAALVPAMGTVMILGSVGLPGAVLAVGALAGAAAGFWMPDVVLRGQARERRAEFRQGLSAFLDLAVIVLAGGGGVQTALERAASAADSWTFTRLRGALDASRAARTTPWGALADLGAELSIGELEELAASVALAGTEGARVRESLIAKAASMRAHELAAVETAAGKATEAMSAPVALLALGFIAFLAFPAVMAVLAEP